MKILLLGSGGREHALAWKMSQSPLLTKLFIAPGNAGTAQLGENVEIKADDFENLGRFCLSERIDLVVVGPEDPLVKGVTDYFKSEPSLKKIPLIGPSAEGAKLEGSKEYAKEFMVRHNIPTAQYFTVTKENLKEGKSYLGTMKAPYVLKADGLAAGKGVLIIHDLEEAQGELEAMIKGKFGAASSKVVIEECLVGIELSVFVLTDGKSYKILPDAKDYKRIGEGDTGLNTGGMGCISPVPFADEEFLEKVEERIVRPTIEGLQNDNIDYTGFVFIGLMNQGGDPYVIEYNVRMGDPETEVIMPRLKSDLVECFSLMAEKKLIKANIEVDDRACVTVMLVSGGYPEEYEKGKTILGTEKVKDSILFHAGTALKEGEIITNGGRVMAVSSLAGNFKEALKMSYKNAEIVNFDKKYYRRDIGFDL
ncbi:MAG: phosphoribosylamine--glycine ligase [Bacteroidales bacterium]|nr:phosphoribosylamine--glycine ligase [Bacteroidales bacterium]